MSAENKELSRRFTELFSTGDEALADEVLAPDVVFHGTRGDGELHGLEEMKAFVKQYRRAFPDAHSTVEDQVAEADTVVTRWRARGTHRGEIWGLPPTGNTVEWEFIDIFRVRDGKLVEHWTHMDFEALRAQMRPR